MPTSAFRLFPNLAFASDGVISVQPLLSLTVIWPVINYRRVSHPRAFERVSLFLFLTYSLSAHIYHRDRWTVFQFNFFVVRVRLILRIIGYRPLLFSVEVGCTFFLYPFFDHSFFRILPSCVALHVRSIQP